MAAENRRHRRSGGGRRDRLLFGLSACLGLLDGGDLLDLGCLELRRGRRCRGGGFVRCLVEHRSGRRAPSPSTAFRRLTSRSRRFRDLGRRLVVRNQFVLELCCLHLGLADLVSNCSLRSALDLARPEQLQPSYWRRAA